MSQSADSVEIALRIPGLWSHPKELVERLPAGFQLTPDELTMPDSTKIGFGAMPADDRFVGIFQSSCRKPPTEAEQRAIDGYKVNVLLSGTGGSLQSAHTMMKAAAAIIRAGGSGVFNDNSGLAHGGQDWVDMTDDGSPDALSFAYVSMVGGEADVWTMGMHVLGLRDIVMRRADLEAGFDIVEVIRYMAAGEKPVREGHIFADLEGPRFQTKAEPSPQELERSPMRNPFGRFRLIPVRDVNQHN